MKSRLVASRVAVFSLAWALALNAAAAPAQPRKARAKPSQSRHDTDLRRRDLIATQASPEELLRHTIDSVSKNRALTRGVTGIVIWDPSTGQEIVARNADRLLNPASNVKLISSAAVLSVLGPDYRFVTRVFGRSADRNGVIKGPLYLRGTSDPSFELSHLDALATDIARRGIHRIEGDIMLSDDMWRDTLSGPSLDVTVRAQGSVKSPPAVSVYPPSSFVQVNVTAKIAKVRRSRVAVSSKFVDDGTGAKLILQVTGTIKPGQALTFHRSVEKRSTFTAYALTDALRKAGVEVVGKPRLAPFEDYLRETTSAAAGVGLPIELARHESVPVVKLLAQVNKRSINWLADRLVMIAGGIAYDEPSSMKAGVSLMQNWMKRVAGVAPDAIKLDTGSGLSYATKLSPRHLIKVLSASMLSSPTGEVAPNIYRETLAVGGIDGTLRGRLHGQTTVGQVLAKTGTLTGIVALSGVVRGKGDRELFFSIVTNGTKQRWVGQVRSFHDEMVRAMADYLANAPAVSAPSIAPVPATPSAPIVERGGLEPQRPTSL